MIRRPPRSTLFPYTDALPILNVVMTGNGHFVEIQATAEGRAFSGSEMQDLLRSEEHTSELQSHHDLVCRLLLEKKKKNNNKTTKQRNSSTRTNPQCTSHSTRA